MTPSLFEKNKFFDLQPDETFSTNLETFKIYAELRERYDQLVYVGDKQPGLYRNYTQIEENFPDATILYILRNVIDVASSYQKLKDGRDHKTWDVQRAVSDWQTSLENTLALFDLSHRRTKIIIISYEELFLQFSNIQAIYTALDLGYPDEVVAAYDYALRKSGYLDNKRGDTLTSSHRYQISLTAPFELYRQLHQRRLVLTPAD